jgi:hypothetical protein
MNSYLRLRQYCSKRFYFFKTWIRCRLKHEQIVYVVGESHTNSFNFQFPFVVYHIGGATAHNIMKENSTSGTRKKIFSLAGKINKNKDILMLVFGEIDCRIHIFRQFKKSGEAISIDEIIDKTIDNYFVAIQKLREMGINLVIYGVPPASYQKNIYSIDYYAEPTMHAVIKKKFNSTLKKRCEKNNIKYVEVFNRFSDSNGFILPEYTDDGLHLTSKILPYIKEFILGF